MTASSAPSGTVSLLWHGGERALRSLPRFEGRSSALTWLFAIARHTVTDQVRHDRARPVLVLTNSWQAMADAAQPRNLPGFEEGVVLNELLVSLPADRREAFVLTQLPGLPYAHPAVVVECPVGTIRSRANRARRTLLARLQREPGLGNLGKLGNLGSLGKRQQIHSISRPEKQRSSRLINR